jgi:uncharacterized NAD(P)/FAD-binding protein YdhS
VGLSERVRRVVIVGAGLGGTATAVRLLQFAREPVEVVVVERRPEYRNAGVAYHPAGNHWQHVFNIQAGRMSMFREDVDDFVAWANTEADRSGWPPEWRGFTFTETGPAPRRIYADYLSARLAGAAREAADGVTLVELDGEVVDLEVADRIQVVVAADKSRSTLTADHVVIATGLQERKLPFAIDHPAFVRHPYSQDGTERILGLRPDASVMIIGSLLSAYDSAALLLRRGHTGRITMISRSGITLRTYPSDHQHQVLNLPAPRLDGSYQGKDALVQRLRSEWDRATATIAAQHPDVAAVVVTERIAKSWEPYLPDVLARIPTADLRALLDGYSSLIATLRVSAVAYTTEIVEAAMADQVAVVTGKVERITGDGPLRVEVSGPARTFEADLVIANFGREPDYAQVRSVLWQNLLRRGVAVRHQRTGRGVEVDVSGALTSGVSAVGGPREGDEIVRYGRMGAFSFNLAAIKNHSVGVAATVLRRLESCYEPTDVPLGGEAFDHSVMLEVRRMASRTREEREQSLALLEKTLAGLGNDTPALRSAVNEAATAKLNDLSVTPRDLRALLGLSTVDAGLSRHSGRSEPG